MDDDFPLDFEDEEEFELNEEEMEELMNESVVITEGNVSSVAEALFHHFPYLTRSFYNQLIKSLVGQVMPFKDLMNKVNDAVQDGIEKDMADLVKSGDVEMGVDEKTGEVNYWLTPKGEQRAKEFERKIIEEIKKEFPGLAGDDISKED